MTEIKEIRVAPDEALWEKITFLMEYLKINGKTEFIRQLITEKYQEIQKILKSSISTTSEANI